MILFIMLIEFSFKFDFELYYSFLLCYIFVSYCVSRLRKTTIIAKNFAIIDYHIIPWNRSRNALFFKKTLILFY